MADERGPRSTQGLCIGLCTIALFGVLGGDLGRLQVEHLGVPDVDALGTQWFYWSLGHHWAQGESLHHTSMLFYPFGKDVLGDTGMNILDALLVWPLRSLLGEAPGTNLFILVMILGSGLATASLARALGLQRAGAVLASVLMVISPFVLFQLALGRVTQALLLLLPLFALHAWRTGTRSGWLAPMLAGLLLAFIGYQYWFYGFFSALAIGLLCLDRIRFPPAEGGSRRQLLLRHLTIIGVACLLWSPVLIPLLGTGSGDGIRVLEYTWSGALENPAASTEIRTVQPLSLASGNLTLTESPVTEFSPRGALPLGPSALLVGLWILAGLRPRAPSQALRRQGLTIGIPLVFFGMGPVIVVADEMVPNPVFLSLVELLPPLGRLWWPNRVYALLVPLAALGAGIALDQLARSSVRRAWVLGGIVFGTELLYLRWLGILPYPSWSPDVPSAYACLAEADSGAIIDLPYEDNQRALFYQTVHHRPILGGMAQYEQSLEPAAHRALRQENAWLASLIQVTSIDIPPSPWTEADRQAVLDLGYRYIVVRLDGGFRTDEDPEPASMDRMESRLRELAGPPVYRDLRVLVYAPLDGELPCDVSTIEPALETRAPAPHFFRVPH